MANRTVTPILKHSEISNKVLPAYGDVQLGEVLVNTADGIMFLKGYTGGTNTFVDNGSTYFEVGSNVKNLKIREKLISYNGTSGAGLSGKFLSGTTTGFVLADISNIQSQAAGDTYEIQFNNADAFAADPAFTFNNVAKILSSPNATFSAMTSTTATITTLTTTTGNITTVNSTTVGTTTVNAGTGNIYSLSSSTATVSGTITALVGAITTVNSTTINGSTGNIYSLSSATATVSGTLTALVGAITTVNSTTINGTTGNFTTLNGYTLSSSTATVSGTLTTTTLVATGDISGTNVTASSLTSGRVVFAGTGGLLSDDADLTFNTGTNTLTATNISTAAAGSMTVGTGGLVVGSGGNYATPGQGNLVVHGDLVVFGNTFSATTSEL